MILCDLCRRSLPLKDIVLSEVGGDDICIECYARVEGIRSRIKRAMRAEYERRCREAIDGELRKGQADAADVLE